MVKSSRQFLFLAFLFITGVFFIAPQHASALVCNDQADGNWNAAGTWSCGAIPGSGDDVTIDSHAVTMTAAQSAKTVTISGGTFTMASYTLTMSGSWTYTGGTLNAGTGMVEFVTSATWTPGSTTYYDIKTNQNGGIVLTVSGTATVTHNFLMGGANNVMTLSGGTINVAGDVICSTSKCAGGTTSLVLNGSGSQTLSGTGGGSFPPLTINKPSGTLMLTGTIVVSLWTWLAGTIDAGTSTLNFSLGAGSFTLTPGPVNYYNVTFTQGASAGVTLTSDMSIRNNLTFNGVNNPLALTANNLLVYGNVSCTSSYCQSGGTTTIKLVGTGAQTLSASSAGGFDDITIDKPSGTLTLSGTIPIFGNWTWVKGKVDAGTSTLNLTTGGGSTFSPGNVVYYNIKCVPGAPSTATTLTGHLVLSNDFSVDCSAISTAFNTAGYKITTKNLIFTSGHLVASASVIKVSGNISGTGTFTAGTSTIILNGTNQTISGTRTYYNLYKILPANTTDTLTFTAGTTYTIASGGTARFIGTRGYPLAIQSSSAGSAFTLTKTGSVIAEYVSLKDCTVSGATSAVASTNVSGNTNWTFTKEFVSTIRATGGDYTTLSGWESAVNADLTAATTKVFAHGGITGTIPDNSSVTGATSAATGTAVHVTPTQILIKSITGTFQSGEQIRLNVSNYVTSSDTGNGAIAVAELYNDWPNALNDSVTLSGWTTDADNFILVVAPDAESHNGKLKDTASGYYRGFTLKPSSPTAIVFDNQQSYTRVIGIATDGTNATATNFRLNGTSPLGFQLLSANGVDGFSLSGGAVVMNSLAHGGTGKCYEDTTGATTHYTVYNSTAHGCAHGFHGNNTTTAITLKNVLASGNSTADYALTNTGSKSVTYSASSDATADDYGGTGNRVSQTFSFIDATNKDFHLAPKDAGARNFGLDLISDSAYPITDDIDGDVRPTVNPSDTYEVAYDIGMDEADYGVARALDGVRLKGGVRLR